MKQTITKCFLLMAICSSHSLIAQPFYGHYLSKADASGGDVQFKAAAYDAQGNMYVAGQFSGTATFDNGTVLTSSYDAAIVAKIDVHGHTVWAKQESGVNTSGYDGANDIAVDGNGNVYIAGDGNGGNGSIFGSLSPTNGTHAYTHGFLVKLDNSGNFVWAKGSNAMYPSALYADANNNVYMAGYCTSDSTYLGGTYIPGVPASNSAFIIKVDGSYNVLASFIADGNCNITDIDGDASGNIAVAGTYDNTLSLVSGDSYSNPGGVTSGYLTPFVAKFSSGLAVQWATTTYSSYEGTFNAVACDGTGNVYVGGIYADTLNLGGGTNFATPTGTSYNHVLAKYNSGGTLAWAHTYGNAQGNSIDFPRLAYSSYSGKLWGLVYTDDGETVGATITNNMGILDINPADGSIMNVIQGTSDTRAYGRGLATWHNSVAVAGGNISNAPGGGTLNLLGLSAANNYHYMTGFMFDFGDTPWANSVNNVSTGNDVEIYPNPTTGLVTIALPTADATVVRVTNVLSGIVLQQNMSSARLQLNLSELPKGTYMISIQRTNGAMATKKVVLD